MNDKICPKCGYTMVMIGSGADAHWVCMSPMCNHMEKIDADD